MPQLHANQIRWEAPEPQKVSLDKPDYNPLADAFTRLGNVADEIGQRQRNLLDDNLKADLKLAEQEANKIIDDAASATADYDQLSEMALSKVQGAFYKYDDATRTRFTRENKTYFDELQLAISDKILKKEAKQIDTNVNVSIPLWASEVMVAPTKKERELKRKEGIAKIQTSLKGLVPPEEIEKKVYQFNNMIDKANLNNLINAGTEQSLAEAKTWLNNPKKATTIDPYEWSVFNGRIIASEQELAKAKKKADDPLSLELIKAYGTYSGAGDTKSAKTLYDQIRSGSKEVLLPYVNDKGEYAVSYIDASQIPVSQRLSIVTEMKKYDVLNPAFERDKAAYSNEVNEAMVLYQKALKAQDSGQDEALQRLVQLENDGLFDYLENGTQIKIEGFINEQMKARVEASLGETQEYRVNKYGYIVPGTPAISYDKKVGNPVTMLAQTIGSAPVSNNSYGEMGGLMAKMMRDQQDQLTTAGRAIRGGSQLASAMKGVLPEPTNPYRSNLTAQIMGAAKIWKDRFATDMERNTISELGLYNKVLLPAMRDNRLLEGTRFNKTNLTYEKAFNQWAYELKRQQIYNDRTTEDNTNQVYRFYEILVGDKLTQDEKARARTILEYAKSGQANSDWTDFEAYLFRPTEPKAKAVSNSNQQRNYGLMKTMAAISSSDRADKAIEKNKF